MRNPAAFNIIQIRTFSYPCIDQKALQLWEEREKLGKIMAFVLIVQAIADIFFAKWA